MPDPDRKSRFRATWNDVGKQYACGYCVSERGLQFELASSLRNFFPELHVIVEPCWAIESKQWIPDIVLATDREITDIFELKFAPHFRVRYQYDLRKLAEYVKLTHEMFPVQIDPVTGQWSMSELPLSTDCRVHFAVVARSDAAAVYLESIREDSSFEAIRENFWHWYGRTGNADGSGIWGVEPGI